MAHQTSSLANQMKMRDREMVPRVLVMAMFALMVASLALVSFAVLTDQPLRGVPADSPVVAERAITLEGTRNAGVRVLDASGAEIAHSQMRRAGFIDVIWVAISRERKVQGITGNPDLRLVRFANGHTAIIDPATDWSIELIGYGKDNIAAFARLLD
ncbi:photosynthetic complex assembly protein PuhC [Marimonas sp. MJW-29]|uniref:Photosynthetic complex assembly protein PuhC n=1 Tax=Sulfitobacter sediminis TaxID=3234186 RepID=A0ABV3RRU3_9RHOB